MHTTNYSKIKLFIPLFLGLFLAIAFVLVIPFSVRADLITWFVKPTATGLADCSDWDNACDLQTALGSATRGDEIWVAEGVHYPAGDASDRSIAFNLLPGVAVYGGFTGNETSLVERDWEAHPTVLSGDLERDDITDLNGVVTTTGNISGTNAYHVVTSLSVTETAVLDGFIITAGYAEGISPANQGGGMYNTGDPTLANLTFSANWAVTGGGLYNNGDHPILTGVLFKNNLSYASISLGGGMYNSGGSPVLQEVVFENNKAEKFSSSASPLCFGGGMYSNGGNPTLTDVTFTNNSTCMANSSRGGGLYASNGTLSLIRVIFRGNSSYIGGGLSSHYNNATLANVLFNGNQAGYGGGIHTRGNMTLNGVTVSGNKATYDGAIYYEGTSVTAVNSIFWGNLGGQISNSSLDITYSIIEGGYPGTGNLDVDPLFVAPVNGALAPTFTGNYHLRQGSPAIDVGNTLSTTATLDLDNQPRVVDGDDVVGAEIDMGPYEFQAYSLTLHRNPDAGGTVAVDPDRVSYTYGDPISLSATANPGWTFASWSGDVNGAATQVQYTITGTTEVTATFTQDEYDLTIHRDPAAGGTVLVEPDQATYHYGDVITLTATVNPGWSFDGWSGDVTDSLSEVTHTITGTTAVTATFSLDEYSLTVHRDPEEGGLVSVEPDQTTYHYGDVITLTATTHPGWSFNGWSGDANGTVNPVTVTIMANTMVTATFTLEQYELTVTTDGAGSGSVTSDPGGIDCGNDCSQIYDYGTMITLTAAADIGSVFTGWGGACLGTGDCTITLTESKSVTATFALEKYALTLATDGNGNGSVTANPDQALYDYGTVVTVTASADTGSTFTGWSGACTGTGNCVITMDAAKSVTATFTLEQYELTVTTVGTGAGSVSSDPAGIDCGIDCSQSYDYGTVITLTATANSGSTFTGWGGACSGIGDCVVTVDMARSVSANFTLQEVEYFIFLPMLIGP